MEDKNEAINGLHLLRKEVVPGVEKEDGWIVHSLEECCVVGKRYCAITMGFCHFGKTQLLWVI